MVPGQPVDQNRRFVLEEGERVADHDLVGRDHALRVDHRLRLAGGAGGEQELGDRLGPEVGDGDIDSFGCRLRQDLIEIMRVGNGGEVAGAEDRNAFQHDSADRVFVELDMLGEDHAGRDQVEDVMQLVEILRLGRIGRCDRGVRHAGAHAAERDEAVIDRIAGEDDDGAVGGELVVDQILRNRAAEIARLAIGHAPPFAIRQAVGEKRRSGACSAQYSSMAMVETGTSPIGATGRM